MIHQEAQTDLLSRLLHRDLADPRHKTNVHLHHEIPYYAIHPFESYGSSLGNGFSFFNLSPDSTQLFRPLDAKIHKTITVSQFLNRKLRWVTLGGQYDWTHKKYPLSNPCFPPDIAAFTREIFPDVEAEAAIVNVYTPGDTLSVHRDVSEECNKGLVSLSFGCDGIFVIGLPSKDDKYPKPLIVRLRSGDAIYMFGEARFAWHGVPRIIPNTCPEWLRSWPATEDTNESEYDVRNPYEPWRDWISNKRVNLNIRQMRA